MAILDNRKWEEPLLPPSVNLGAGDCLDVTVPTAENPWDFYIHPVSQLLQYRLYSVCTTCCHTGKEFLFVLQVSGEKDRQRISNVLSQHMGHLKQAAVQPYKYMLCCCQFSEDGCWYRAQVKGKTLIINFSTLLITHRFYCTSH